MEIVVSIAVSITAKIAEYSVAPIGRSIGYLIYYHRNMKNLEEEVENLGDIKTVLQLSVDAAKRNGEVIGPDVERWLTTVNGLNEEVKTFLERGVEINKHGWWCPDPISRYSLSRKAKKKTRAVTELKGKGSFQRVSYPSPPLGIEHMATGGFTDFESRKLTMEKIMAALKDDNINAIGICGLGGVGKTTAVEEVGKRAKVKKLFDEIVMAVVAQKTVETIQGQIADMLGLKFEEESITGRASRLRSRLMNCKRVLVILDDVWGSQNLEEVGIPFGGAHKGCKVILTSRNQDACNGMGPCQIFPIGVLSEQEAWSLFKDKAGNSIDSPDLYPTATEVVKECGALPIAIATVGKALKDKSKEIWEDALLQLRQSCPENISGMNEKVYLSLELSFNLLQSEEAKSCLLLCCIFEEDADIPLQDLVRFGVGLCLFKRIDGELVQATNRVHTLVDILKSCYLLLDSVNKECVKMHDVVRDVIISIATAGKAGLMLRHGLELKEWPTESTDQLYTSTSFMSNKIPVLLQLDLKEWPKECFTMEEIGDSVKMPENLFEGMKELRVLRLRRMFIPSPPPSLALLTKLQTLCIEDCNLKNISLIGELKTLKILSFCGSTIQELPVETGKLTHLRSLDLTQCNRLERISPGVLTSLIQLEHLSFRGSSIQELPMETGKLTHLRSLDLTRCLRLERISPGVLSSLIRLEQLYMRDCGVRWEVEEGISERNNVNVAELKSLSDQLTALEIELPASSAKILGGFKNLVRFYIMIGDTPKRQFENKHVGNELIINLDSGIPVESWINDQLPKKTEILHFQGCSVKNVLNSLNKESLVQLKFLHVCYCNELEYVIDTVNLIPQGIFPILDTMVILGATNLKMICHGQLPAGSFAELRFIRLTECKRLENVFSQSIAKGLVQLEILDINDCEMMEEIIVTETEHEEVSSKIRFPKLRHLSFWVLPSLVGFCKKMGGEFEFPQLRTLNLTFLRKLRSLCPSSQGSHECDDSATATQYLLNQKVKSLCELRSITVNHCGKLVNVFSSDSIQSLHNLEEICISKCDSVEVALDFVGVNIEEGLATAPLSRLKKFELSDLPKLICVWKKPPKRIHECQKLQSLKIERCSRLKNIFSPSTTKIVEQLQELDISECETMTEIVVEDEGDEKTTDKIEFLQLRHLSLSKLPNLLGLFPKEVGSAEIHLFNEKVSFPRLEKLTVSYMENFGEIWCSQPPSCSFYELRILNVSNCHKILHVAPFHLLKRLQNLEAVHVRSCDSVKEVFEFIGPSVEEGHAVMLSRLERIFLASLPKLMQICKKDHNRTIGFQNLKMLHVSDCATLRNLFNPSMARGLLKLEDLYVSGCVMMEEIVAKGEEQEEEEGMDKIVIPKLKQLSLYCLQNLISFCQSLYAFDLPLLDIVRVEDCPNMKTFSSGFASTPKLKKVRIKGNHKKNLMGDLNNTIQQLFQTQASNSDEDEDEDEDEDNGDNDIEMLLRKLMKKAFNSGSDSKETDDDDNDVETSEPEEDEDEDEDEDDSEDECNSGSNNEEIDDVEAKNDGASSLKMGDAVARLSDSQGTPMELKVNQETVPQENGAQRDQSPN